MATHLLSADELLAERPFTHPHASSQDLDLMQTMHQILCQHARSLLTANVSDTHIYRQIEDESKAVHRLVLPNWPGVTTQAPLTAVGFFGQARLGVDHSPILDLENRLIATMPDTPGLLAYYNLYWPGRGWGNLVLFSDDRSKNNWGHDQTHRRATHLSPHHYHSIRLHNGRLPDGLLASPQITLTTTKYLDFRTTPIWRGERQVYIES